MSRRMAFLHLPPIRWLTSFYNPPNKQNKKIAKLSHNINSVTSVSDTNNNHSIIVELHKKINREQKEQLTIKIKKNFPHIDKIEYVLEDS